MAEKTITREWLMENWKQLDDKEKERGGKPLGRSAVCEKLKISLHWIQKLFSGERERLTQWKERYGIRLSSQETHLSENELYLRFDEVVTLDNEIPNLKRLTQQTGISEKTWKKNAGGGKEKVEKRYAEWLSTPIHNYGYVK